MRPTRGRISCRPAWIRCWTATATYEPADSGGVFAYGTHAVVVAVDPDSGVTELLDYVVSEDCGTMINPMIVDGQVQGGIAQGIGTALYEEIPYDEQGQPLATTFADYMVPCAPEIPTVRIEHLVTPALTTEYGVKGLGEGGAIAPPAAIANAVADAFADIGASFNETPLTPRRVSEAIERARRAKAARHEIRKVRLRGRQDGRRGRRGVGVGRSVRGHHCRRPIAGADAQFAGRLPRPAGRYRRHRGAEGRPRETPAGIRIGALTTHADIEDGKIPDPFGGLMRKVAAGISYRAVRNYGTIGGSVALADPAADWPVCLMALGADVRIAAGKASRSQPIATFIQGQYTTALRQERDHRRLRHSAPRRAAHAGDSSRSCARAAHSPIQSRWRCSVVARPVSVALGGAVPRPFLLAAAAKQLGDGETSDGALRAAIAQGPDSTACRKPMLI